MAYEKRRLDDLAVFGGPALFTEPLLVGRPNLGDRSRLLSRIEEALDRRWLSNNGPFVQELERRMAERLQVRHCLAMVNGTVALEIAARAAGLTGEVIVPAFTFIATAHALQWQQITPVFCDIDERTHNIDPAQVEALITPRTSGIMPVHIWGRPAPVEALAAIARRHQLRLIFDASHGIACSHAGRLIGGFGDAEVLSFHASKLLNSFEGGAVTTNDDALAERIRGMRNFGFGGYDDVRGLGVNGKMNEAMAAMGLTGLESLDRFIATNRSNYHAYREALQGQALLHLAEYDERESCTYSYVVLELDAAAALSRDQLVKLLVADGVVARRYFYPGCHRGEPYRSLFADRVDACPATDRLAGRVLALPTGSAVSTDDIRRIGALLRFALAHAPAIADRVGVVPADAVYGPIR